MRNPIKEFSIPKAYIIFENNITIWWLRFLKKGFRHCYLLLCVGEDIWLEINPTSNQIIFSIHQSIPNWDYIDNLCSDRSKIVLSVPLKEPPMSTAPIGFFTCVEFTKRCLGIQNFFIITPYQLYKKLIHNF